MEMNPALSIAFIKMLYKGVLREILLKVVMDTKYEWDDKLLELTDAVFGYEKKGL